MQLAHFIAKIVKPGEPLTAQAWNDLVKAVEGATDFLLATTHSVKVRITNTGLDPATVRIVAHREGAPPVEAVRPYGTPPDQVAVHTLAELEIGQYKLRASAPGFKEATKDIDVTEQPLADVELSLEAVSPIMPDLFGVPLKDALDLLTPMGVSVTRVLDFTGKDVPPANPPPEAVGAPVLVQHPPPGTPVIGGVGLVVAITPVIAGAVAMPSLAGLTEVEARKALEGAGLVVGRITVLEP